MRVAEATATAVFSIGAKPMLIWIPSPLGIGKAADPMLPMDSLTAALKEADVWVEFNKQWLLYSLGHSYYRKQETKVFMSSGHGY